MKRAVFAALSGLIAFSLVPAHAENGRNAALLGGLAAGALVGGAIASQAAPAAPAPVYEEEDVIEAPPPPRCFVRQQPLFDAWGNVVETRRVRVCR